MKHWVAWLAIAGLLLQAGFSVWHATAMFAQQSAAGETGAHVAMMCQAEQAGQSGQTGKGINKAIKPQRAAFSCPCCLGLVSSATAPADSTALAQIAIAEVRFLRAGADDLPGGRHLLAPESRGPPLLV